MPEWTRSGTLSAFQPDQEGVPQEEAVRVVVRAEEIIASQADGPEDADQDEEAEGP
jgi:hypothetical protein